MRWRELITSPPPTTGWSLDSSVLATVKRDPKGALHCLAEAMPEGVCEVGPVGLQAVDGKRLEALLISLQARMEGARRVAVVVPTGWLRCHLLSFDELPRRQAEIDQVVQWRLKKLLPVLPSELRVSALPLPAHGNGRQLLCTVGVERALAELERSFVAAGVQPGQVTGRLFPLAGEIRGGNGLVIQVEEGFLSLLLVQSGVPRMTRTKPLVAAESAADVVTRELHLTLQYIRGQLAVEGTLETLVSVQGDELQAAVRTWLAEQEGVAVTSACQTLPFADPRVAAAVGEFRLAPVLELIHGNVR